MTKNVQTKSVEFDAKLVNGAVTFSGITRVNVNNSSKGDYHFITFILDDDTTGKDLIFRPISNNLADSPFWIQPIANGCPQAAASMPGVVEPMFVSPNGKELTVIDYNSNPEELRFALRLVERANPASGHEYDPIMNNQNGGRLEGSADYAAIATIGLGVAAIAAILYVTMYGGMS